MSGEKLTKASIMNGVDCVSSKVVANNTVEYRRENGDRVIRFQHADILTFHADGAVTATTGGWKRKVTKDRLNQFLDSAYFHIVKGTWYMSHKGKEYPYSDGIHIGVQGNVSGCESVRNIKRDNTLRKLIKRYCDKVRSLEKLPEPSAGDCWYCSMHTIDNGESLGDAFNDSSHIVDHVRKTYIHGSLILNAMRHKERNDFVIAMAFQRKDFRDIVVHDVRSYLKHKLNLA